MFLSEDIDFINGLTIERIELHKYEWGEFLWMLKLKFNVTFGFIAWHNVIVHNEPLGTCTVSSKQHYDPYILILVDSY